jgi:hypothetical protein
MVSFGQDQTGSGTYVPSYKAGTQGPFTGGGLAVKLDTRLHAGPVYLHSPIRLHGVRLLSTVSVTVTLLNNCYATSHICIIRRNDTASLDVALHVEGE